MGIRLYAVVVLVAICCSTACSLTQIIAGGKGNGSAAPYLLGNGQKDACLADKPTFKDKAECLQALVENYYGLNFTAYCPSLSLVLVEWDCRGCPWDRVNPAAITPVLAEGVNRTQLFHRADESCLVAHHVERYRFYSNVRQQIFVLGIFGALLLFLVTEFYSPSHYEHANGGVVLGRELSEPSFLLIMWTLYNFCNVTLSASEDYFEFCEAESDKVLQDVANKLGYVVVLVTSLSRCRRLVALQADKKVDSWQSFINHYEKRDASYAIGAFLWYVGPVILLCVYIVELMSWRNTGYEKTLCYAGTKNARSFSMHLSKLLLEMLVVTIYAYGPSIKRPAFYSRYLALAASLGASLVLLGLTFAGYDSTTYSYMMIPRVPDAKLAYLFVQLGHIIYVALLGLFEPVRIGWPPDEQTISKSLSDVFQPIVEKPGSGR